MGNFILLWLGILFVGLVIGIGIYIHQPMFGNMPSGERLERIKGSPHYIDGEFKNLEPATQIVEGNRFIVLWDFLFGKKEQLIPQKLIPVEKVDLKAFNKSEDIIIWLGHSSYYMQLDGKSILIDPVFSAYASPISFINKAFDGTNPYTAEDIPDIDVLLISHDHWNHLDYSTIMSLKPRINQVVCALGVGTYFEEWGFEKKQIFEEDWFAEIPLQENFAVCILPAQHFSGRLLKSNQTLWASFAITTKNHRVFYSGDGGYGKHFKEIGERFGNFDIAIMENGQYNKAWARIHMMPEETAQAAEDIQAKVLLPAHTGKFALSKHSWEEPFNRIVEASEGKNYRLITPKLGEVMEIGNDEQVFTHWWE